MDHVQRLGGSTAIGALVLPQLLVASVVGAHLLYRYVEEPSRRALRGRAPFTLRRRASVAVPSAPAAPAPVIEAA
jgi:peptidoglycan/LPS O-acetylase OafA/YrhL